MPINRHRALEKLSQDHNQYLLQAQAIRQLIDGDEQSTNSIDLIEKLLDFWNTSGELHLREEEEVTYPFFLEHVPTAKKEIDALKIDHTWLRDKFEELSTMPRFENTVPVLRSLGEYMVSHIRHEERVTYEQIQSSLTDDALVELAMKSQAFRKKHRSEEESDKRDLPNTGLLSLSFDD